jgi:hypothetical protein
MMDDLNNDYRILSPLYGKERLDMITFPLMFYLMSELQDKNKEKEKNLNDCKRSC